jgi:hypothetical protein
MLAACGPASGSPDLLCMGAALGSVEEEESGRVDAGMLPADEGDARETRGYRVVMVVT